MMPSNSSLPVSNQLNQHNYELAEPEVVVNQIIAHEKEMYQEELLEMEENYPPLMDLQKEEDSGWEKQRKLYLKIERYIRKNFNEIPTWEVASPLHYGMTQNEMEQVIRQKFQDMVTQGKLMKESSLMKKLDRSTFYPPTGKGSDNLTRIWGADFLRSKLRETSTLDAAEHFLVVDDGATEIEVQVHHSDYPCLSIVKNAHILSKKIEGERKAWDYRFSDILATLRYRDFKDIGNIIEDTNGIGWVVDTEHKSFDPPELNRNQHHIQSYLKKRFEALSKHKHSCLYQTFRISVSDIGINSTTIN